MYKLNRRIPNGTYGGVEGEGKISPIRFVSAKETKPPLTGAERK